MFCSFVGVQSASRLSVVGSRCMFTRVSFRKRRLTGSVLTWYFLGSMASICFSCVSSGV